MRRYPVLKTISVATKAFAIIELILGVAAFVMLLVQGQALRTPTMTVQPFGVLLGTLVTFVALWAIAELIMLFVHLGEDVSRLVGLGEEARPGVLPGTEEIEEREEREQRVERVER